MGSARISMLGVAIPGEATSGEALPGEALLDEAFTVFLKKLGENISIPANAGVRQFTDRSMAREAASFLV